MRWQEILKYGSGGIIGLFTLLALVLIVRHAWNKGLTRKEDARIAQPWLGKKRSKIDKNKIGKSRKGKTYEEIYGKEKAKELKEIRSINGKIPNAGHFKKGYKPWNKGISFNSGKNHSMYGKKHKPESRLKQRLSAIKRIKKQVFEGNPVKPNLGKHETYILDILEKYINYKILRQFTVNGYFLDGYCPALNLAIEIDEPKHKNKSEKDKERQMEIEKEIGCQFLRIPIEDING